MWWPSDWFTGLKPSRSMKSKARWRPLRAASCTAWASWPSNISRLGSRVRPSRKERRCSSCSALRSERDSLASRMERSRPTSSSAVEPTEASRVQRRCGELVGVGRGHLAVDVGRAQNKLLADHQGQAENEGGGELPGERGQPGAVTAAKERGEGQHAAAGGAGHRGHQPPDVPGDARLQVERRQRQDMAEHHARAEHAGRDADPERRRQAAAHRRQADHADEDGHAPDHEHAAGVVAEGEREALGRDADDLARPAAHGQGQRGAEQPEGAGPCAQHADAARQVEGDVGGQRAQAERQQQQHQRRHCRLHRRFHGQVDVESLSATGVSTPASKRRRSRGTPPSLRYRSLPGELEAAVAAPAAR